MDYPTTRVIYDRRKVASSTKKGTVQIVVTFNRVKKFFPTGVSVYPNQWDITGQVYGCLDMMLQNRRIEEAKANIDRYILSLMEKREPFTFDGLKRWMKFSDESTMLVADWIEDKIESRNDIREGTRRNHMKIVSLLRKTNFIKTFSDLTMENVGRMDDYLHRTGIRQTTIATYHKFLKNYAHKAMVCGLVKKDPYMGVKIDIGKSEWGRFLTLEEVETIENTKMHTASMEKIRLLFLFQCYTGLAYSDLMAFDSSKVTKGERFYILTDERVKTGEGYTVVLTDKAMDILQRFGYHIPQITCEQYNMRLKVLADACGIEKPIASHYGRRTCGMILLNEGFPIEIVAKVLGHSSIRTTQSAYAKILDRTVEREFIKHSALSDGGKKNRGRR